jgi:hypothetical protein
MMFNWIRSLFLRDKLPLPCFVCSKKLGSDYVKVNYTYLDDDGTRKLGEANVCKKCSKQYVEPFSYKPDEEYFD